MFVYIFFGLNLSWKEIFIKELDLIFYRINTDIIYYFIGDHSTESGYKILKYINNKTSYLFLVNGVVTTFFPSSYSLGLTYPKDLNSVSKRLNNSIIWFLEI